MGCLQKGDGNAEFVFSLAGTCRPASPSLCKAAPPPTCSRALARAADDAGCRMAAPACAISMWGYEASGRFPPLTPTVHIDHLPNALGVYPGRSPARAAAGHVGAPSERGSSGGNGGRMCRG